MVYINLFIFFEFIYFYKLIEYQLLYYNFYRDINNKKEIANMKIELQKKYAEDIKVQLNNQN